MKSLYKKMISFILLGFICCIVPMQAQADETGDTPAGFTVESVIPENQVDVTKSYFYLQVEPETEQVIQVKVRSKQEEPVTVKLAVHDAVSSSVGAIDYAKAKPNLDESLKQPITELVKINDEQKEITVANFEEKIVEYTIKTPKEPFSGVKLGSLRFVKKDDSEADKEQSGVVPEYAYVIAMMLTQDKETFNHGADLKLKEVDLKLSNGRKVVAANLQNDQPKVLQELKLQGQVKRKGETDILAEYEMEDFSVAPNSNFDFEIPLGLDSFRPGTYVFTGEGQGDGRTWRWEQEFTIGQAKADKVNEEAAYQLRVPGWVPWVAAGLLLFLVGLIGGLIYRQKQWTKGRK